VEAACRVSGYREKEGAVEGDDSRAQGRENIDNEETYINPL
jgi:hypothetical protein